MFKYLITASAIIALLLTTANGKPAAAATLSFPAIRVIPIVDDDTLDSPVDAVPTSTTKYENDLGFPDDTDDEQTDKKISWMNSLTEAPETESKADDDSDEFDKSVETGLGINDLYDFVLLGEDKVDKERQTEPQLQDDDKLNNLKFLTSLYLMGEVETMKSENRLNEIINEGYMKSMEIQLSFNNQLVKSIIHIHRALERAFTNNLIMAGIIIVLMVLSVLQGCRIAWLEKEVRELKRAPKTDSSLKKEVIIKV